MTDVRYEKVDSKSLNSSDTEADEDLMCRELLLKMGRNRDREAFDELYEYLKSPIFNMACYMVRDRESAREVVQEIMLALWDSSPFFKPGPAKGWIYRIASHKCLSYNRKRRNRAATEKSLASKSNESPNDTTAAEAEHNELLMKLREIVTRLDLDDRRLVTLYYGAGISQQDIAHQLKVSQRTVSTRLDNVIRKLRSALNVGEPVTPAIWAGLLEEALRTGITVPDDLRGLIFNRMNRADSSTTAGTIFGWFGTLKIKLVIAFALILGGIPLCFISRAPEKSKDQKTLPIANSAITTAGRNKTETNFPYEWNFQKKAPKNFRLYNGDWHWTAGQNKGRSGMVADGQDGVCIILPIARPAKDFILEMDVFVESGSWQIGSMAASFEHRILMKQHASNFDAPIKNITEIYNGTNVYSRVEENGSLVGQRTYASYAKDQLLVRFKGLILRKIKIRKLTPEELASLPFLEGNAVKILKTSSGYRKLEKIYTMLALPPQGTPEE